MNDQPVCYWCPFLRTCTHHTHCPHTPPAHPTQDALNLTGDAP